MRYFNEYLLCLIELNFVPFQQIKFVICFQYNNIINKLKISSSACMLNRQAQ